MSLKLSGLRPIKPVFSEEELDRIKGDNPPLDVAMRYGLQPKRTGTGIHTALCPFHAEKTGSFTIYADHFHCFGCGWSGDVIRFVECIEGIGFKAACEHLGARAHKSPEGEEKRAQRVRKRREKQCLAEAKERLEKEKRRQAWPPFDLGSDETLQKLADLRSVSFTAVKLTQMSGVLRFCRWRGHRAWVIGDSGPSCAQARRLDGQQWENGAKAWTLPGSELKPIGLTRHPHPVVVCEGAPDLLSTWHRLHAKRVCSQYQPVCMLGTSVRFGSYASMLRDRAVTIYPHRDENGAGLKAARAWEQEAMDGGAKSVDLIEPAQLGDLNDLLAA